MIAKLFFLLIAICGVLSAQQKQDAAARRIFALLNQTRAEHNLPPLRWDSPMAAAADRHTRDMATLDQLAHQLKGEPALGQRLAASGTRVSAYAENVGYSTDGADGVHDAWMHSPGHRANILNSAYDVVGIAAYEVNGKLYATEDFGTSVNIASAEDAEVTIREAIAQLRAVHKLPALNMRPLAHKSCQEPVAPPMRAGETRSIVRYTSHDPRELPQVLKARISDPRYRSYWMSVCEQRSDNGFTSIAVNAIFTN